MHVNMHNMWKLQENGIQWQKTALCSSNVSQLSQELEPEQLKSKNMIVGVYHIITINSGGLPLATSHLYNFLN